MNKSNILELSYIYTCVSVSVSVYACVSTREREMEKEYVCVQARRQTGGREIAVI